MPADEGQRRVEVASDLIGLAVRAEGVGGGPPRPDEADDGSTCRAYVRITVTDNGPGLTPEQAGRCSPAAGRPRRPRPGRRPRLGLALVAQAVARCGGTVRADPGRGARFVVACPTGAPQAVVADRRSASAERGQWPR